MGFICDLEGRRLEITKVIKILEWAAYKDETDARAFLGIYIYYRIWIMHFALIVEPIFKLFKKGTPFKWKEE